jgi:hypothetical protein
MRRASSWVLLVLGAALIALAVPVGYLNRTVLDAPTFASRVDELRRRDDVSSVIGREVSQQLIAQNPDLVALAPLVEQVSIGVVGSDALSGPVQLAASQFHRALTEEGSDQLVLRVADAGAVVAGVIGAMAPERAPQATAVAATLADIGAQAYASEIVGLVDLVDTLAWVFPLFGVAALVAFVFLQRDRWDGLRRAGWALVVATAVLAGAVVVGGTLVRAAGGDARADAVLDGVWEVFVRPVWWSVGLLGALGALLVAIGSGWAARWTLEGAAAWMKERAARPTSTVGTVLRALLLVVLGVATVLDPQGMLAAAAFVVGPLLVVAGLSALSRLAPTRPAATVRGDGRSPVLIGLAVVVSVLAGLAVWAAVPPDSDVAGAQDGAVAGEGEVCNGHAELCDRRFDEVSFAATHNSMAVAGKPGWYLGEQGLDVVPQLDAGVRALLIDVWYGHDAGNGRVRTSARSYEEALAVANEEVGPEIVAAALRVIDAVAPGEPIGPEALFMCHGLCETGATSLDATLLDIRAWLATHPDEVLTLFIEDHVDAADVAASVIGAGLEPYLFTPMPGDAFPRLGDMIRSGRRLVVMLEEGSGGADHPWLANGFDYVQETPYTFPTVESFSCAPNRGTPDAPLLQINHWLSGFTSLVSDAELVNAADVLGTRAEQCRAERGLQPTFVAVNYADIGDLFAVVDTLNGVA